MYKNNIIIFPVAKAKASERTMFPWIEPQDNVYSLCDYRDDKLWTNIEKAVLGVDTTDITNAKACDECQKQVIVDKLFHTEDKIKCSDCIFFEKNKGV